MRSNCDSLHHALSCKPGLTSLDSPGVPQFNLNRILHLGNNYLTGNVPSFGSPLIDFTASLNCLADCSYTRQLKCPCGTRYPTAPDELTALIGLYNATGGPSSTLVWDLGSDACVTPWSGVLCQNSTPNAHVMYVHSNHGLINRYVTTLRHRSRRGVLLCGQSAG